MPLIAPAAEWDRIVRRLKTEAPEAFLSDGRVLNLIEGEWRGTRLRPPYTSPAGGPRHRRISPNDIEAARPGAKYSQSQSPPSAPRAHDERRGRGSHALRR